MALTSMPNDDGTLTVIRGGQEITLSPAEDLAAIGFTPSEQHFLQDQFQYAVPGPVACRVPDPLPPVPDFPPEAWSGG
jgi:hypothetical protein